jgi:hypothetical protein
MTLFLKKLPQFQHHHKRSQIGNGNTTQQTQKSYIVHINEHENVIQFHYQSGCKLKIHQNIYYIICHTT